MTSTIVFFIISAICGLTLVTISAYTNTKMAFLFLFLGVANLTTLYIGTSYTLGEPKPVSIELRKVEVAQVLWSKVEPGNRIYLMLTWKDLPEPTYYYMEWSKDLEDNLSQAQSKAIARGTPLMIRNPFGKGCKGEFGDGVNGKDKQRGSGTGSNGDEGEDDDGFYVAPPPPAPVKGDGGVQDWLQ